MAARLKAATCPLPAVQAEDLERYVFRLIQEIGHELIDAGEAYKAHALAQHHRDTQRIDALWRAIRKEETRLRNFVRQLGDYGDRPSARFIQDEITATEARIAELWAAYKSFDIQPTAEYLTGATRLMQAILRGRDGYSAARLQDAAAKLSFQITVGCARADGPTFGRHRYSVRFQSPTMPSSQTLNSSAYRPPRASSSS